MRLTLPLGARRRPLTFTTTTLAERGFGVKPLRSSPRGRVIGIGWCYGGRQAAVQWGWR